MFDNYYHILGLNSNAKDEEIKRAYRELAMKYHPDKHNGDPNFEEKFKRISYAHQILIDPIKRAKFDGILAYRESKNRSSFISFSSPSSPNYSKPKYNYKREKVSYTEGVKLYGKLFILGFISFVILVPIGLFYYTSIIYYQDGLEYDKKGDYISASNCYRKAISFWSGRNVEATIRYAEIYLYKNVNYQQARQYLQPALNYTKNDSSLSILHYYMGVSLMGNELFDNALSHYNAAEKYGYRKDSLEWQKGKINGFRLSNYEEGISNFEYLIAKNVYLSDAYFGKAWCLQHSDKYRESILYFDSVLYLVPEMGLASYYKGISFFNLSDTLNACRSYFTAIQKGFPQAQSAFDNLCVDSLNNSIFVD